MMGRPHLRITVFAAAIVLILYVNPGFAGSGQGHGGAGQAPIGADILDGKKFKGSTGEKGKKAHHVDILIFADGRFTSTECFQFGFKSGPYSAIVQNDSIHFKAQTHSPTHGKMVWSGTLSGNDLDVTYSWTKERWLWTTHREYWFKGTLVK